MSRNVGNSRTAAATNSKPGSGDPGSSAGDSIVTTVKETFKLPKLIFFFSFVIIALVMLGVYTIHNLTPFLFVILWPVFFIVRIVYYVKKKWYYMLFDFCHFEMAIIFAYLLGGASSYRTQQVCYGFANGPLIWAVVPFAIPNAFAPHLGDKMCSIFIHYYTALMMATLRWFPSESSTGWHLDFYSAGADADFTWMVVIPFTCYAIHYLIYMLVVYVAIQPGEEYLTSYRYLVRDKQSFINKAVTLCGERFLAHYALYTVFSWLLCLMSLLFSVLWYESFAANICFLVTIAIYIVWSGAYFHVDVYSKEGLVYDDL